MYCDRYCFLCAKTEVIVPRFFLFSFFFFSFFYRRTVRHPISSHGTVVVQLVNHSSEEPCTHVFKSLHRHTHEHVYVRYTRVYTSSPCKFTYVTYTYSHMYHSNVKRKKKKKKKGNIRKKISENREYLGLIIIVLLYLR